MRYRPRDERCAGRGGLGRASWHTRDRRTFDVQIIIIVYTSDTQPPLVRCRACIATTCLSGDLWPPRRAAEG